MFVGDPFASADPFGNSDPFGGSGSSSTQPAKTNQKQGSIDELQGVFGGSAKPKVCREKQSLKCHWFL